jgi:opacity protein-like surface antigen
LQLHSFANNLIRLKGKVVSSLTIRKIILTIAISISTFAMPLSAFAGDGGHYFAFDVGSTSITNQGAAKDNTPTSYRIGAGYLTSGNVTDDNAKSYTELSYYKVTSQVYTDSTGTLTNADSAIQLTWLIDKPVLSGFDALLRLGVGFNSASIVGTSGYASTNYSGSNNSFIYGAGLRYNLTENWKVDLTYEYLGKFYNSPTSSGVEISQATLGLKYRY